MPDRSAPSTAIRPESGTYSPVSSFTSVVLPAPLMPTSAVDEPTGSVRSRRDSTGRPGSYAKDTPSNAISRRASADAEPPSGVPVRAAIASRASCSNSSSASHAERPYTIFTSDSGNITPKRTHTTRACTPMVSRASWYGPVGTRLSRISAATVPIRPIAV